MDDARIKALTQEVLSAVGSGGGEASGSLESRVAALEAAVRRLQAGGSEGTAVAVAVAGPHPSHGFVGVPGGGSGACLMEPDKPCVGSGACRTFGH